MTDRAAELERQEIRLPDGRRLIYYPFPGTAAPRRDPPVPETPPSPPPREER